jgi:hypothetical protein
MNKKLFWGPNWCLGWGAPDLRPFGTSQRPEMADRAKHHFGARLEIQNNSKFVLLSVFSLHLTKHTGDSLLLFL